MATEGARPGFMNAKDRVNFLLEVSRILRLSLDLTEVLPALGRLIVPVLADWVAVDVAEEDRLNRLAVVHADPAKAERARTLVSGYRLDADAAWGPARAMTRRHLLYFPSIDDPTVLVPKGNADQLAAVAQLGLGAVACVPMITGGHVTGVLIGVRNPPRPAFSALDMAVLRQVATRAGEAAYHGQLFREVQAASRAKDEFLAMLGHELRNPIAAIMNAVKVLEHLGSADEPTVRVRGIIDRQAQHLSRLVDDLLDLARITSGKITLRRRPVDLRKVAKRCLAVYEENSRHELVLDAESAVVAGDPTRLEQILDNLVGNAVKYTPPGGRIEVTVRRNSGSAVLAVRDTGIGIAPDLLPRIFDLFAQAAQPLDRQRGGLGIGLTLVRRLVELHEGTVAASSPGADKGTLVEIRLPLAMGAAPAVAEGPRPVTVKRRILIVEDNADARDALAELLSSEGHTVEVAKNGPQALEVAGTFRPDVALIDIGLPGMDGYEVARRLRALGGPPMHLVALTGYGQPADRQRTREAGFEIHLVKPVDPENLGRILAGLDQPAVAS
jgi:signal transduction histidine kinase